MDDNKCPKHPSQNVEPKSNLPLKPKEGHGLPRKPKTKGELLSSPHLKQKEGPKLPRKPKINVGPLWSRGPHRDDGSGR